MRVEDLTKFEGECPTIVVFSTYMDIRIPLTKKWKKIINEKEDKPNTYHNNLIDYISEQIELSGFNMKSIGNLLIKKIVFNENNYYRYNNIEGFPITINDLGYWNKNRVRLNEDFHGDDFAKQKHDEFYAYVKHHCPGFEDKIEWEYFQAYKTMPWNLSQQVKFWSNYGIAFK